jgi:hypothetical protein
VNNVQVEGCGRIKETDFFRLRFNQKETKASGKIYEVLKGMEEGCLRSWKLCVCGKNWEIAKAMKKKQKNIWQ